MNQADSDFHPSFPGNRQDEGRERLRLPNTERRSALIGGDLPAIGRLRGGGTAAAGTTLPEGEERG